MTNNSRIWNSSTTWVKVKGPITRPGVAQRVGRRITLLFHDRGTGRGWVVSSTPLPHFTPGKDPVPFYRRLGGPQGRSGWAENLVPTGIRSRTFQPVVSRYNDWVTGPTNFLGSMIKIDARCTFEFKPSIAIAKAALSKKKAYFTSKDAHIRKQPAKCYAWNVVVYCAETWTLRKICRTYLENTEMRCWRRVEEIS